MVKEAAFESGVDVDVKIYQQEVDDFPKEYGPLVPPVIVINRRIKIREMRKKTIINAIKEAYELSS